MDKVTDQLISVASHDPNVKAVVLMGSYGACPDKVGPGSDLDLLFILTDCLEDERARKLLIDMVLKVWSEDQILLCLNLKKKVAVYIQAGLAGRKKRGLLKLDMNFAQKAEEQARYLRGSEGYKILLNKIGHEFVNDINALMQTKAHQCLPEYKPQRHVDRFLEMFELTCKSAAQRDEYRTEFHAHLIRHALVVMEQISLGVNTHLYLPKRAFEKGEVKNLRILQLSNNPSPEVVEDFWRNLNEYCRMFIHLCKLVGVDRESTDQYEKYMLEIVDFYS